MRKSRRRDRVKACELAAIVMAGRDLALVPQLWSVCVFFENYIGLSAEATQKDFGPKKPVRLKAVRGSKQPS